MRRAIDAEAVAGQVRRGDVAAGGQRRRVGRKRRHRAVEIDDERTDARRLLRRRARTDGERDDDRQRDASHASADCISKTPVTAGSTRAC